MMTHILLANKMPSVEQPPRLNSIASNPANERLYPREGSFYNEHPPRLKKNHLSITDGKHTLTKLLWPRLVLLRTKQLLAALAPLMRVTPNGTFGLALGGLSYSLTSLGWALHGLRLFMNALLLLQHTLPGIWMSDEEKQLGWQSRFYDQFNHTWTEFGSDLIWMASMVSPNTFHFTMAFLIVDFAWVGLRAWIAIDKLMHKQQCHDDVKNASDGSASEAALHDHLSRQIAHEHLKLMLNLAQVLSISGLFIIKNFMLPVIIPSLATNPIVLAVFATLILSITLINHYLAVQLEKQKPAEIMDNTTRPKTLSAPLGESFFKAPLHKVKKDDPATHTHDVHLLTA